nr:uncharacterized protein LOC109185919 [Ipomoea batatas]
MWVFIVNRLLKKLGKDSVKPYLLWEVEKLYCRQIMSTDIEELARANNDLDKDLRVFWSSLPSPIHCLGKEVMAHRNAAFCSAMQALERSFCCRRCHSLHEHGSLF